MTVAYHKGTIVYAYKGVFNYNIDHDWTGGVLVDFKKIVDQCTTANKGILPAPSSHSTNPNLLGLAFDKHSPYNHLQNCDTIWGSLDSPAECRWHDCHLPSGLSTKAIQTQQTVAIYVC